MTIIKTTKAFVFGAFASVAWESTNDFKQDPSAFIVSLINASSSSQLVPVGDKTEAIYCNVTCGPTFGGGHDMHISDNSNTTNESYSNLGCSYDFKLFASGTTKAQSYLASSRNFQTSEIEVFQLG